MLILRKDRPKDRRDKVLLVYAARHYRELSNQNQLRPQDIMRMLVHYHAYGDAAKAKELVARHSERIRKLISHQEQEEVDRVTTLYQEHDDKLAELNKQAEKSTAKLVERDEIIAEARRRAEEDRMAVVEVGGELIELYADPNELVTHTRPLWIPTTLKKMTSA